MQNLNDVEIQKCAAFIIYEVTEDATLVMNLNEKADVEQKVKGAHFKFPFNQNLRVFNFQIPEKNFLKDKNVVIYELAYNPLPLVTANYFSAKYSFQLKDQFSYYFMIGLKFQRNDRHSYYKEPPGKAIDDDVLEFYYFFMYATTKYVEEYSELLNAGKSTDQLVETAFKQVLDLIEIFKMINRGALSSFPRQTIQFLRYFDEFIQYNEDKQEFPELFIMIGALFGLFPYDNFINRDYSLKKATSLLNMIAKCPIAVLAKLDHLPMLKQSLINGIYVLMNFSIKEGTSAWLNILESAVYPQLFEEQGFYIRVNEFIRRSGNSMITKESFGKAKEYLIRSYMMREKDLKNPAQSMNAVLKNIAILSTNKENLLDSLFEFYDNGMIDVDKLRNLKEEIRRKKWNKEDPENFGIYISKIKVIIDQLETKEKEESDKTANQMVVDDTNNNPKITRPTQPPSSSFSANYAYNYPAAGNTTFSYSHQLLTSEFKSLLYDLSSSIKYIFTLMKQFNFENIELYMVKRAINSIYDLSLDDYTFILSEIPQIPEDIRKEITDTGFYDRIKFSLKRVMLPFDENSKEILPILLQNPQLFPTGSLEFVKEFIRNKPQMDDLIFIVSSLIMPQRELCNEEEFKEMFIYCKNYLMSNLSDILDLIRSFSCVIGFIGEKEEKDRVLKTLVCEDFWRTVNQRYSPEVFLGLSQIFNERDEKEAKKDKEKEKDKDKDKDKDKEKEKLYFNVDKDYKLDDCIENSYIQYVKSIVESINTDIQNFEKINQFFNSLSTAVYTDTSSDQKEKIIISNNASTEKIINSILDILIKASDPTKLSRSFLLENPSKDHFWYRIIKARGKFVSFIKHTYVTAIINEATFMYDQIKKGNLTISDFIIISKYTPHQKDAMISYCQSVLKNVSYPDLANMIDIQMNKLADNLYIINEIDTFFSHYGNHIEKSEDTIAYLKKVRSNFKTTEFRHFVLQKEILEMKNEIRSINQWAETVIFRNTMDHHMYEKLKSKNTNAVDNDNKKKIEMIEHQEFIGDFEGDLDLGEDVSGSASVKKSTMLTIGEVFQLAKITVKEINDTLNAMIGIQDFSKLSLGNTMKYFQGLSNVATSGVSKDQREDVNMEVSTGSVEDYNRECELIERLLKWSPDKTARLKEILKTFCEISIFIKFSTIMIRLDSSFRFSSNNVSEYYEFLGLVKNHENSFDKIFKSSQSISNIRDKYFQKFDLENLIHELAESKDLVTFLINTPDEDIRNMVDAVDEHGDSFIRVQTIRDLLIIGSFVRMLKLKEFINEKRENNPSEEEMILRIITTLRDNNTFTNIDALINSCNKQFLGIKHLHNELSNREEASKIKAKEICKDSYFEFNFHLFKKGYEISVSYGKSMKRIQFRDLCDLRDRVLLLLYNEKEKLEEEEITNSNAQQQGMIVDDSTMQVKITSESTNLRAILTAFIKVVDISEKVIFILNDLFHNGYPININKQVRLKDGDHSSFQAILEDISTINSLWNEDLKEAYTRYYPLTYYNGNQFWQLESLFTQENKSAINSYGLYLLKYADQNLDVEKLISAQKYSILTPEKIYLTPKERINKLGEALNNIIDPSKNGSNVIQFKKKGRVQLNIKGSHFIFSNSSTLRIYHHLLSVHFSIENALPAGNQIFYCTKETTFHQVISFLYRFVYCPVARLFTMIRVENLSFELQNFLVEQVNKIMKASVEKTTVLVPYLCLISSDSTSFIHTQFAENPYIYQLKDFDVLDEVSISGILKSLNLNTYTIRSDDTGAGKTFFIKTKALAKKDIQYVNFPIIDSICIDKISERLYDLNHYTSRKFIHLTLMGIIDDFEMLDYILFKYIFLGCIKNDIFVSFRSRDDPIYIEISNTYNDFLYNAISILPLLPHEEMLIAKDFLHTLDIGKYVNDPIQVVCNFLYQHDQGNINEIDISPNANINTRMFTADEALELLNKYFINENPDATFRQIQIFVNILSDQMLKFAGNYYFKVENIKFIQDNSLADVRSKIISSLLLMTREFTTRSIKAARESQNMTSLKLKRSITRENVFDADARAEEINSLSSVMSWSQSNHLLIMFHDDGMCMTPVYRERSEVPQSVKQMVESQKSMLDDYQRMSHETLLAKLHSIAGRPYIPEMFIDSSYVMTADNFLKMLLIIIRARCGVPIVIMGETGCGKTSLVRFLATRVMQEGFEVINFHAGIKEGYIIDRMNDIKQKAYDFIDSKIWVFLDEINTCDCLGLITEIITQNSVLGDPLPYNIIFIAACNPYKIRKDQGDVGLIKQRVATKLVYRVHPLPDSLIDYVWDYGSLTETEEKLYIGNILSNISGDLKDIAIDLVIKSQVFTRQCEDKFSVSLRDVARFKILHEWFFKIIQEKNGEVYVKKENKPKEEKSSYGGYGYGTSYSSYGYGGYGSYGYGYGGGYGGYGSYGYGYGGGYGGYGSYSGTNIKYTGKLMMARKALILSLLLCYYNRISKNNDRSEYKKIIIKHLAISDKELEEMINEEQRDIVTRMELPPAIAINKAILENVFTLMVCVINKIPLFICGKPGCSKSLAVQLLVSNLRGQDSTDPFFKKLPRILAIPYQGSESSTSEGIEKIFEKANNVLKNADKSILPLIVFDEIGLAEISKNNPLKILHSLLEPECPVVAFVGISNWRLDASKMNRAVYLARPDPDLDDLESTALSIFEYYNKEPRFDEREIMKALALTYFEFKVEQSHCGYSDFHGTRDFYSLIKQVTRKFSENYSNYNEMKYSIVKDALSRNFGGLANSITSIHSIFSKNIRLNINDINEIQQKGLMELVKENLRDRDSRFLLLFTNGESASYILDNYLKTDLKERIFIIGSEFEGDKDKEEHSFRLLSDIILYMESGSSIIMKNLDQIYGSLYDLFNQNFMIVGSKKNCRIALGSTNNPMCFVHNNFHCVVLVDIRDLKRMDPPFLNRFEKQILTFESVLTLRQKNLVVELNRWIKNLTSIANQIEGNKSSQMINQSDSSNKLDVIMDISDMIITYNDEFCPSLALLHYAEEKSNEDILELCKKEILSVANISLIVYSVLSDMHHSSRDEIMKTHRIYFDEQYHDSLSQYLNNTFLKRITNSALINTFKLIVYTYSNILDEIKFISTSDSSEINYSIINIAEIKTEKDFDHRFKLFLGMKDTEWLFIKIDVLKEKRHIAMIKFRVDKFLNEYKKSIDGDTKIDKNVVMIVYLSRTKVKVNEDTMNVDSKPEKAKMESHFLSGWNQITIDCINGGQIDNLKALLDLSTIDVVKMNLDRKTISEMVFNIYLKFNFVPHAEKDTVNMKEYMSDMMRKIENDPDMYEMLIKKCLHFLVESSAKNPLPDWKIKICCDNKILSRSLNTFNAIRLLVGDLIEEPLLKIIHYLETESALFSFFLDDPPAGIVASDESQSSAKIRRTIWNEIFDSKDLNQLYPYNAIQSLIVNPVFNLKFPFSKADIYEISLTCKDYIDNIYIIDNESYAKYVSNNSIGDEVEDNKILYNTEFENTRRVLRSSIVYKILNSSGISNLNLSNFEIRNLISTYIHDIITYFITVEIKIQLKFKGCFTSFIEKFIGGIEDDSMEHIFIFLWKNKKIFMSIFNVIDIISTSIANPIAGESNTIDGSYVTFFEDIFKKDELYKVNRDNRKHAEIELFIHIYTEIAKILLTQLNTLNMASTSIKKNFAWGLNSFISSLINFSLEIKETPPMLNLFIVINEYLKILSMLFENDVDEIVKRVTGVLFAQEKDIQIDLLNELKNFNFIPDALSIIDTEVQTRHKIGMPKFEELAESIINSKLTMFDKILAEKCSVDIQTVIVNNIIKDTLMIKYSSVIFYRIFNTIKISDSLFELSEDNDIKEIFDNAIVINDITSYDHILYAYLSDFLRKFLSKPSFENSMNTRCEIYEEFLEKNYENFEKYLEYYRNKKSKFVTILGFAGLKHYLEYFGEYLGECYMLSKNRELIKKINDTIDSLDESKETEIKVLITSSDKPVAESATHPENEILKNYILKALMKKFHCNAQALANINFQEIGIKWINNKLFENNDNLLGHELNLPFTEKILKEYSSLFTSLINEDNADSITTFKQLIERANIYQGNSAEKDQLRFVLIQFFINKVYLSFSNQKFHKSLTYNHLVGIFEATSNDIREHLGDEIFNFIQHLVYNFTKKGSTDSFFKITQTIDASKLGMLGYIMQLYNYLLSFRSSNIFMNIYLQEANGTTAFVKNFNHFAQIYLPGGFVDFNDENLLVMMAHVDGNYEVYGSQLGLYECSCGYLYTIGDCTRPYYTANCPKCSSTIGGSGHVLSERAGHICLINADNKNEANRKQFVLDHLSKKLHNEAGFISKMPDELPLQYSLRSLNSTGFRWVNFAHNAIMYLLVEFKYIDESKVRELLPKEKSKNYNAVNYIKGHLESDTNKFIELLKVKDWYIFPILALNALIESEIAHPNTFIFTAPAERDKLEKYLHTKIFTPLSDANFLANEIQSFKSKYSLDKNLSYSRILDENFTEEEINTTDLKYRQYLRIFRLKRSGDWEDLKNEYLKEKSKHYQFLKLLIEKFDEIILLSNLYPIVQFTNYMLNLCNYRLTRQEAKEKKIEDIIGNNSLAEKMFKEFACAWKKVAPKCSQYACKVLPVLESIDADMPVSFVLIDDRELGYGMYMASCFQYLCQVQNEVLEAIVYLIKENTNYQIWGNMDIHKYPIQKISAHEIIMYQTDADAVTSITDKLSKFYEIYNDRFGGGSIVEYNFEKIESELAFKLLTNKKILNHEDIIKIQYKFELLSINNKNSNLLNDIKGKIEQKMFHGEEMNVIKKTLEKLEQQNVAYLHQIFSSLEIILCTLRYSNNVENSLVSNYVQKIQNNEKISFLLKETQPLCSVRLSNIIAFYELVEEKLFKHIVDYISPDYCSPLNEGLKKSLNEFLNSIKGNTGANKYPSYDNLISVIQRFIIRCLVATIEPKFPIKEYLMRSDFWDIDIVEEQIDNFYNDFPDNVLIANTLPLLEYLKDYKRTKSEDVDKAKEMKIDINVDKAKFDQMRIQSAKKKEKFI